MYKIVSLVFMIFYAANSWAALPNTVEQGQEAGFGFCQNLTASSDRKVCATVVRATEFFQVSSINQCTQFSHSARQLECFKAIPNKIFTNAEMKFCMTSNLEADRLQCLKEGGFDYHKSLRRCEDPASIYQDVTDALSYTIAKNPLSAEDKLREMRRYMEDCLPKE